MTTIGDPIPIGPRLSHQEISAKLTPILLEPHLVTINIAVNKVFTAQPKLRDHPFGACLQSLTALVEYDEAEKARKGIFFTTNRNQKIILEAFLQRLKDVSLDGKYDLKREDIYDRFPIK